MIKLHAVKQSSEVRRRPRRWWSGAAWAGSGIVLYALALRISFGGRIDSDGANSALQAWDLIHGHLLLHGWLLGDATFYFFELPLIGVVQLVFGLGTLSTHVASALVFLIVAACVVALAVTGSRGPAKAARSAVAVAVLAGPLLTMQTVWLLVEEPDQFRQLLLGEIVRPHSGIEPRQTEVNRIGAVGHGGARAFHVARRGDQLRLRSHAPRT